MKTYLISLFVLLFPFISYSQHAEAMFDGHWVLEKAIIKENVLNTNRIDSVVLDSKLNTGKDKFQHLLINSIVEEYVVNVENQNGELEQSIFKSPDHIIKGIVVRVEENKVRFMDINNYDLEQSHEYYFEFISEDELLLTPPPVFYNNANREPLEAELNVYLKRIK